MVVSYLVRPGVSVVKRVVYYPWLYLMIVVAWALMCLLPRLFVRFEVRGKDRMQWDGRTLYLGRHRNGSLGTFGVQGQLWYPKIFWYPESYPYNVAKMKYVMALGEWAVSFARYCRILSLPEKGRGRGEIFQREVDVLKRPHSALTLFPTGTRDHVGQTEFARYHSSTAMGRLLKETKPKVVFYYDNDSHVFTGMLRRRWELLQTGSFWYLPVSSFIFHRPKVVITVSKVIDTSKIDTKLGRLCHDPSATAEEITQELWKIHALWAKLVDPQATLPPRLYWEDMSSEDFEKMYHGETY